MLNKDLVRLHFSEKAHNYDKNALLQKDMASRLVRLSGLKKDSNAINVLDVGCGTGFMTHQLSKLFDNGYYTLIDISGEMVNICRKRFYNIDAEYICADVEEIQLCGNYDIIVSNAAFQWFNHLSETMSSLANHLKSYGILLFSTFGEHTFRELHSSHRIAMQNLSMEGRYTPGQEFTDVGDLRNIIHRAFESRCSINIVEEMLPVYFDSVLDFFNSVRAIGANNSGTYVHNKQALLRELIRVYEDQFRFDGKIRATYHCVYGAVTKLERK